MNAIEHIQSQLQFELQTLLFGDLPRRDASQILASIAIINKLRDILKDLGVDSGVYEVDLANKTFRQVKRSPKH